MKTKKNIRLFLIGPQHVGKSSIGILLSKKLEVPFMDSDNITLNISEQKFSNIRELYKKLGREAFLNLEAQSLLSLPKNYVFATGGGIADNQKAIKLLKKEQSSGAIVILLQAAIDTVWPRILNNGIPAYLTQNSLKKIDEHQKYQIKDEFSELFEKRILAYQDIANLIIDADNKIPISIAAEIIKSLKY